MPTLKLKLLASSIVARTHVLAGGLGSEALTSYGAGSANEPLWGAGDGCRLGGLARERGEIPSSQECFSPWPNNPLAALHHGDHRHRLRLPHTNCARERHRALQGPAATCPMMSSETILAAGMHGNKAQRIKRAGEAQFSLLFTTREHPPLSCPRSIQIRIAMRYQTLL